MRGSLSTSSTPSAASGPRRLDLRLQSDPAQVAGARRAVERFATSAGFGDAVQSDIGLCVNEALANIIRHAYGNAGGQPIAITADYSLDGAGAPAALRVTIRDWGTGVNPAALPD